MKNCKYLFMDIVAIFIVITIIFIPDKIQAPVVKHTFIKTTPAANEQIIKHTEVYIAPTGKKYHFKASCAGKNAMKINLSEVIIYEPCKKCAQ